MQHVPRTATIASPFGIAMLADAPTDASFLIPNRMKQLDKMSLCKELSIRRSDQHPTLKVCKAKHILLSRFQAMLFHGPNHLAMITESAKKPRSLFSWGFRSW